MHMPEDLEVKNTHNIEFEKMYVDTYAHNFGILIPCKSGIVWEQQTEGVCCHHVCIEGIFIPLDKPFEIKDNGKTYDKYRCKRIELLDKLTQANYKYKDTTDIWARIRKSLDFEYDETEAPDGMPCNQEGLQWILLKPRTKEEPKDIEGLMIDPYDPYDWIDRIANKPVVLIYPNCD
jgi:hypothetical protein